MQRHKTPRVRSVRRGSRLAACAPCFLAVLVAFGCGGPEGPGISEDDGWRRDVQDVPAPVDPGRPDPGRDPGTVDPGDDPGIRDPGWDPGLEDLGPLDPGAVDPGAEIPGTPDAVEEDAADGLAPDGQEPDAPTTDDGTPPDADQPDASPDADDIAGDPGIDPGPECAQDLDCDDEAACTTDTCIEGRCVHAPKDCSDGDPCTIDVCHPITAECVSVNPCEDGDPCTHDDCDPSDGRCLNTPDDCTDGDLCTTDFCDPTSGCFNGPVSCDDGDPCTAGMCDPDDGSCVFIDVVCVPDDRCHEARCDRLAGGCVQEPILCDDGDPCTFDGCNPDSGCTHVAKESSDGNPCTLDDCDPLTGEIRHDPVVCDPPDACHLATCDPLSGACIHRPRDCSDDDPCTIDACDVPTGDCLHEPVGCTPENPCQEAWCDPATGLCRVQPVSCNDRNPCTTDNCDPATGACLHLPVDCDDQDVCTVDQCDSSVGCHYAAVDCDDGDAQTIDSCDPATGCIHVPVSCDDGDACTIEQWSESTGCGYTPRNCDDGNACTLDGCDSATGCTHAPVDCDDGNACTLDGCESVLGCWTTPVDCDDLDPCTLDGCDPSTGCTHWEDPCVDEDPCTVDWCDARTGDCVHEPMPCEPPDVCHTARCLQGLCMYAPVDCDDHDACTTDACDPATGCTYAPVDCDDHDACTTDACDPATGCTYAPVDCDDRDACTTDACDPATGCTYAPIGCDDHDACTTDACAPATGCTYAPIDCDDHDACTTDACDPATGCTHTPFDCDDHDACTTDTCDPATGCTHQWICAGETCGNGIDDDDNGLRDCADPACLGDPSCHGDTCDDPWVLPGTAVVNVDTLPLTAGFPAGCEATPGTDIVFRLDVPVVSDVHVSTLGSDYDTAASLRASPCTSVTHLACNDDIGPRIDASRLEIRGLAAGTWFLRVSDASGGDGGRLRLNVVVTPTKPANWPATTRDPLVRMPGTQPTDGLTLEAPANCTGCHGGYDPAVEPSRTWRGSMMAQASRDFLFWASMAVAIQDSLWALGTPNAADLCERCHFPQGWVEGRSDPPNASLMTGSDYDGVHCDVCHSMVDPHFEDTFAGTREGADWAGYWDETNASATPSSTAAATTRTADRTAVSTARFYNGTPYFGADYRPVPAAWNENASGQFFLSAGKPKRAPFADAGAKHQILYSRHHKSRYFCATCHDVTNPALSNLDYAGLPPGPGAPALPSETLPAWDMTHVERTFSEFMLSAYGAQGGAPGTGTFAPDVFATSHPGNAIATCQDCHMADLRAMAANKGSAVLRPDDSVEHPKSGMPDHAMAGGNPFVLRVLASTVAGSPNYDAVNAGLLNGRSTTLTLDMNQGLKVDAAVALEGADKSLAMLSAAASIEGLSYTPGTGATTFRVVNHTGHKLLTGFPEGRRVFVNVRAWQGATLLAEINPYDATAGTLKGLPPDESPASPALAAHERHQDDLVYECRMASSLTGEEHTFHFVLSTHRQKDNRVPPRGFRIADAPARKAEPVEHGEPDHDLFTAAEYAGGHDAVALELPPWATRVEVTLYYQATSREYVAFLRDEINGLAATLSSPTPTGEALTYVSGSLPFFDRLRAWGDVIWQLWDHNRNVPGAAPVPMAQATWGS